jgi:hypothetical protein
VSKDAHLRGAGVTAMQMFDWHVATTHSWPGKVQVVPSCRPWQGFTVSTSKQYWPFGWPAELWLTRSDRTVGVPLPASSRAAPAVVEPGKAPCCRPSRSCPQASCMGCTSCMSLLTNSPAPFVMPARAQFCGLDVGDGKPPTPAGQHTGGHTPVCTRALTCDADCHWCQCRPYMLEARENARVWDPHNL